ncbi:MAG: hypothetical protein C0524_14615 [Rhodobacter sp.]|nr:hypothetical protein [Rhodobacter sp.]
MLDESEINAHLAAGGEEAEVYARVNRALLPVTDGTDVPPVVVNVSLGSLAGAGEPSRLSGRLVRP